MIKNEDYLLHPHFLSDIEPVCEKLLGIFKSEKGARIGQSTVCSQKMHSFHPKSPEEINILQDFDAGQAFYQMVETGSIYHLDIFHQCGQVNHIQAAIEIQQVIEVYNRHYILGKKGLNDKNDIVKADFIDIQTSTGGGRITGKLNFGKKLSLRKAHINHVHLAVMIPSIHLACLIYIIMAVENIILSTNLELRCNEIIRNIRGANKKKNDLTAYIDKSDSLLQGQNHKVAFEPSQGAQGSEYISDFDEALNLQEFSEKNDKRNVESMSNGIVNSCRATETFLQEGMIELTSNCTSIEIEEDNNFNVHLEEQLPEIEAHLRKVVWEAKRLCKKSNKSKILKNKLGKNKSYDESKEKQHGDLATAEMIHAAARRVVENGEGKFEILHDDIRYFTRKKSRKIEFCILIDASSSMEGQRIQVAKLLIKHLFFSANDCISVIVFQQNRAWLQVPFTHDFRELEQRLEEIKAYGETPLALGLTACLQYIEQERACNPIIILITDGVPTLGTVSSDPIYDALQVAKKIKSNNYGFTCIGLKPHLAYLQQLSEVAGGSIYAVENLSETVGIK